MTTIKRYKMNFDLWEKDRWLEESPDGDYVKWEDCQVLLHMTDLYRNDAIHRLWEEVRLVKTLASVFFGGDAEGAKAWLQNAREKKAASEE